MAKKRTKTEKGNAHHPFLVSWQPSSKNIHSNKRVKRELKIEAEANLAVASVKRDILKSVLTASLIIASMVVLYLGWPR